MTYYLERFRLLPTTSCWFCACEPDDAYHTIFTCGAWETQRTKLVAAIGEISPDNLVDKMMTSEAA